MLKHPRERTLIYLHIPKTAGSTLSLILVRQYALRSIYPFVKPEEYAALQALPPAELAKYKLFQGHFPYGLHESLPQPSVYMTTLRDPLQVALSGYFYFELGYKQDVEKQQVSWAMPTLDEVRYGKMRILFDNSQTRFLSGHLNVKIGSCSREMLDLAKQHLEERFVVGLVERFDESIYLMSKILGWHSPFYLPANITHKRPRNADVPPDVMEWLQEHNQLDMELYEFGKALYAKQIAAQGEGFAAAVQEYQRRNKWLGPVLDRTARVRRRAYRTLGMGTLT